MAKKIIVTIARQFGSGGREIGELIAKSLGIPIYDKELITDAAAKSDLNVDVLRTSDESAANSLLYTLAMGSNVLGATNKWTLLKKRVYEYNIKSEGVHYRDYEHFSSCNVSYMQDLMEKLPDGTLMTIGSTGVCVKCGEDSYTQGALNCDYCM